MVHTAQLAGVQTCMPLWCAQHRLQDIKGDLFGIFGMIKGMVLDIRAQRSSGWDDPDDYWYDEDLTATKLVLIKAGAATHAARE